MWQLQDNMAELGQLMMRGGENRIEKAKQQHSTQLSLQCQQTNKQSCLPGLFFPWQCWVCAGDKRCVSVWPQGPEARPGPSVHLGALFWALFAHLVLSASGGNAGNDLLQMTSAACGVVDAGKAAAAATARVAVPGPLLRLLLARSQP